MDTSLQPLGEREDPPGAQILLSLGHAAHNPWELAGNPWHGD